MKTLPDGRIQVEAGDTLSGIYGSNWQKASGYTGDPTKLAVGTVLPAKSANSIGGGLTGGTTKELPVTPTDKLTAFRNVLSSVTQKYNQEANAAGMSTTMKTLGAENAPMSGRSLANIVNFVKGQKTGVKDIYKTTIDSMNDARTQADKALQMAISTGAITQQDDTTLANMAEATGYSLDLLKGVREAKKKDVTKTEDQKKEEEKQKKTEADQQKRDDAFEKFAKDMADKVYNDKAPKFTREEARNRINAYFPEYDGNVIYDLVPDKK